MQTDCDLVKKSLSQRWTTEPRPGPMQVPGWGRLVILVVATAAFLAACGSDGGGRPSCSRPESDCTLAEAAAEAGVWIGAAINDPDAPAAQAVVPMHFNSITAENAMKWGSVAPTVGNYDFSKADAVVDFADSRGVRVRGHTLVWRTQQPADLRAEVFNAPDPPARMREILAEHISTEVGRYRGRVAVWDVVNEPLAPIGAQIDNNLFMHILGETYLDEAFHLAHAADPHALLFLNEFFLTHTADDARVRAFRDLVSRLLARSVPIHGVGIQAHFPDAIVRRPERAQLEAMLRSFTDLGVVVEITELDVSINYFTSSVDPLAAQAAAYGDLVGACMSVPGCQGVTTWGIDDAQTWLDKTSPFNTAAPHRPLLFDAALMEKPAYFAVRDVVARTRR